MTAHRLLQFAERSNPLRNQLLVSTVLGKHVPVPASVCRLAGGALALAIAGDERAQEVVDVLVGGDPAEAARVLAELADRPAAGHESSVVVGMAETATALGHQAAEALDAGWFQTSTRHPAARVDGLHFSEVHSHAADQWFRPPLAWPAGPGILIDDELTTGRTAATLIELLHGRSPRTDWVVGALVDARPPQSTLLEQLAGRLRVPVRVVALGKLDGRHAERSPGWSGGDLPGPPLNRAGAGVDVEEFEIADPGPAERDGMSRPDRVGMRRAAAAAHVAVGDLGSTAIVLGFGEHLALSQMHAMANGGATLCSSTTRSPALVNGRLAEYPLRSGVAFHVGADPAAWFAYNVEPSERSSIVVHFPDPEHRRAGQPLLDTLRAAGANRLVAVTCASRT